MKTINDFGEIYIYSPSLKQDLYQKLSKCLTNFTPTKVNQSNLDEDSKFSTKERANAENFQRSETEMKTIESREKVKQSQDYNSDYPSVIILNYINEKEINNRKVQASFKRSRQSTYVQHTYLNN